ncbi:HpcH/HpaI aldolase/citrate lyase family protein [Sphingobium algorifonticola]|uniref:CoA ester lyase n=1 Tax=Sphingobium algorifonticola TaxID=2008318 RepID=A0A437J5B9_9SPHN|nr:CoA ester lyase [Sphingobium algorifonticola]RVT40130.1 CoA ester lyase [Sphingobium algorifonticola]
MKLRSLLFVPGDRPDRFAKAAASGADALILDLEDSVAAANKASARHAIAQWLRQPRDIPAFVRTNPLDSGLVAEDLAAIGDGDPDGLMLPKAEGAASVEALLAMLGGRQIPILPIASETAAAVFQLGSYASVARHLAGLTWGAEDLPAAIGAATAREADGSYTAPYQMVRALTLFGAHAASVPAVETVFPDIRDSDALAAYAARGRRDGFTGMMAIHPAQVPVINAAFAPTDAEIAHARAIVSAFDANPDAGALQLDGRMIDAPHLKQAQRLLAQLPTE